MRTMLLIASLSLIAISCVDLSGLGDFSIKVPLEGTWKQTSLRIIGCTSETLNMEETPCQSNCQVLVLTKDSWSANPPTAGYSATGHYTTNGVDILVFTDTAGLSRTIKYIQNATVLTLIEPATSSGCIQILKYGKQ